MSEKEKALKSLEALLDSIKPLDPIRVQTPAGNYIIKDGQIYREGDYQSRD